MPVGGLVVLEDIEAGVVEGRAIVADGVVADDREAAGAFRVELEGEEGERAFRPEDAREFAEGGGLVGGVLEGVDAHRGVHGGGLEAGVGEAAWREVRHSGEAKALRALIGVGDGDGGEVDAEEVGAGIAGDPEGGAAHAAGDVAEARAGGEVEGAGEVAEVREGDEADVIEVVGVVGARDEVFPEAEEGRAAGHRVVDGVVALGDDGGVVRLGS